MEVRVDPAVLEDVARRTTILVGELPPMLAQARALDAAWAVSGLDEIMAWAEDTTADLQMRMGYLRLLNGQTIRGFSHPGFAGAEIAGARTPLAVTLAHLHETPTQPPSEWARRSNESLEDWIVRVRAQAIDRVPHLDGSGEPISHGLDWFGDYATMLYAGGMGGVATVNLVKVTYTNYVRVPRLLAQGASAEEIAGVVSRFGTYRAPGTTLQSLILRSVPVGQIGKIPPPVSRAAFNYALLHKLPAAEALLPAKGADTVAAFFGKDYTFRTLNAEGNRVTVSRGATNLIKVGQDAAWGSKISTVAKTAGAVRSLSTAGSAASVGFDVANLAAQGDPVEAFKRDKAGYVADLSKTAFDVSMTAAMVAPTPWTWGAVALTGTIYAGAELVNHWDEVSAATSDAAHWIGENASDVVTAPVDAVAHGVDAVVDSKVNPMNWF